MAYICGRTRSMYMSTRSPPSYLIELSDASEGIGESSEDEIAMVSRLKM